MFSNLDLDGKYDSVKEVSFHKTVGLVSAQVPCSWMVHAHLQIVGYI